MNELELALRALAPAPSRLDRDRLMFEAGALARGGTGRGHRLWPAAAAILALVAAGESLLLVLRPAPRVLERLVVVREPGKPVAADPESVVHGGAPVRPSTDGQGRSVPPEAVLPASWETIADVRRLQDRALRLGLDDLPDSGRGGGWDGPPVGTASRPASVGELRILELERALNPGDRS